MHPLDIFFIAVVVFLAVNVALGVGRARRGKGKGDHLRPLPRPMQGKEEGQEPRQEPVPRDRPDPEEAEDADEVTPRQASEAYRRAQATWDHLRSDSSGAGGAVTQTAGRSQNSNQDDDFLRGAKVIYSRVLTAWESRDFEDLEQFTTASMLQELQDRAARTPPPAALTEVLYVDASVAERETGPDQERVTVNYEAMQREGGPDKAPKNVREVWRFVREAGDGADPKATWRLDAIQRLQ